MHRTPKQPRRELIPEFEEETNSDEETSVKSVMPQTTQAKNILQYYLDDLLKLTELKKELYKHATSEGKDEKRKGLRSENSVSNIFVDIAIKMGETISRLEARTETIGQLTNNFYPAKVDESIKNLNEAVTSLSKEISAKNSYADALRIPTQKMGIEKVQPKIQPKEHVVIVKPRPAENLNENESRRKIRESLKHVSNKNDVQVKKTVDIRGGAVLLVLNTIKDKQQIINNKVLQKHHILGETKKKNPKVIIYDIPSDINQEEIANTVFRKNEKQFSMGKEEFITNFKPAFKVGPRNKDTVHWVVECEPKMRRLLINQKKVFLDLTACNVRDYVVAPRCYNCQEFGHVKKHCSKDKPVCGHCTEIGHEYKNCPKSKENPKCYNCKIANKNHSHSANDPKCPSLAKATQQIIDKTNYGDI